MPSANFAGASAGMAPLLAVAESRNLFNRFLSGAVLAPVAIILVLVGGLGFDAAVAIAAAVGLVEWLRMVTRKRQYWSAAAVFAVAAAYVAHGPVVSLVCLAVASVAIGLVVRARGGAALLAAFGLPYVGLTLVSLIWLRLSPTAGWPLVLFIFLVVWGKRYRSLLRRARSRRSEIGSRDQPEQDVGRICRWFVVLRLHCVGLERNDGAHRPTVYRGGDRGRVIVAGPGWGFVRVDDETAFWC